MVENNTTEMWDDPTDDTIPFLMNFRGLVRNAYWSSLAEESEGKVTGEGAERTQLYWELELLDIFQDFNGTPPDSITISFSTGSGWWTTANDDVVEHEDQLDSKPYTRFRANSGLGRFLKACVKGEYPVEDKKDACYKVADGGDSVDWDLDGVGEHLKKTKAPYATTASIWKGMIFDFRGLAYYYRNKEGLQEGRGRPHPVRFLGTNPDAVVESTNSTEASSSTSAGDTARWEAAGASPATARMLATLEGSADTHEDFVKNALLITEVKENENLANEVKAPF